MKKLYYLLILLLVMFVSCRQNTSVGLLSSLPAPRPELFANIRDSAEWKNPALMVAVDYIELLPSRKVIMFDELESALQTLPRSAWPYGRVVGLQMNSLASEEEHAEVSNLYIKVRNKLMAMDIHVEYWPSA